jgi:hypothetical protein
MGLDILLGTTNQKVLDESEQVRTRSHNLSRTFCNLMCRKDAIVGEPELDQISRLVNVDVSPLYDMEKYVLEEDLQSWLEYEDEEDRPAFIQRVEIDRASLEGNIDLVYHIINTLLIRLERINNLPNLLNDNGDDVLNNKVYFADFNLDKGEGYIGNNFGQDLRNFQSFLEYAKRHNSTTVFFVYG